jgi:hypothetical protein
MVYFNDIAWFRADTGAGKTEVIIPVRAVDGGPHHQMMKKIELHRFYVYPLSRIFVLIPG